MREFIDKPASRESTPILIGIMGPSGGGKTYSALRLATGIQKVSGGDIGFIDTEARRALHYADKFKFRHLDFKAPFGPLDYLAAIEHFTKAGVKTIIVDSMSHEHEGEGGVLDQHERIMGGNEAKSMAAWAKPKSERRRLINGILQLQVNLVFCFRAKEKIKMARNQAGKLVMSPQGWMPIAGEEFLFEQTLNVLLLPKANGIPEWNPTEPGERLMTKLPEQFFSLFSESKPLDESTGRALAEWAKGSNASTEKVHSNNPSDDVRTFDSGCHNYQENSNSPAPEYPEGFADDQDYQASLSEKTQEQSTQSVVDTVSPAGALSVEGPIENIYAPKSEKAPWNIVIQKIKMAVWSKNHPKQVAWLKDLIDNRKPIPKTRFRADYTTAVSGQYTNHTLVAIESLK